MTSATTDLVGRGVQCASLMALLDEVCEGDSRVLEISGPAGIGKTALLDWLQKESAARDLLCLRSSGFAAETDQPFGVLMDFMDQIGDQRSGTDDRSVRPETSPESDARVDATEPPPVERVLQRMRGPGRLGEALSGTEELTVCRAVRDSLSDFATESEAMVLIVDDVHWVDEATNAVLGFIARHDLGLPTLLVLASRLADGALVATGLDQLNPNRVRRLPLKPLSPEEVRELLTEVPEDHRRQLVDACGGNPFYAVQLAQHHAHEAMSDSPLGVGSPDEIPQAVLRSIVIELENLGSDARRLVEAAAVLADPFESDQAAKMVGLSDEQLAVAIDELVTSGLIVESDNEQRFRFRHPILASATRRSIAAGTLQHLHGRAAVMLREGGSDSTSVARHLEISADVGDLAAVEVIAQAADENRSLAPATSARLFASALRLLPTGPAELAARMRYMDGRADCLIRSGEFEEAHEVLLTALELVTADDAFGQAWLTINCVRVEEWLGLDETATERLERTWRRFTDRPGPERALLEGLLMIRASEHGDVEQMRSFGERVVETMSAVPHPYVDFTLSAGRALCEARIGSVTEASQFVQRAAAATEQLSEQELSAAVEPLLFLSSAELWLGMAEAGLSHAQLGLRFAKRNNNALAGIRLGMSCESGLTALGRLSNAAEIVDDEEQVARQLRQLDAVCYLLGRKSAVAALRGDWVASERATEECEVLLNRITEPTHLALASFSIGRPLVASDRAQQCIELIQRHAGGDELSRVPGPLRGTVYETLVEAELAMGRVAEAEAWWRRCADAADRWDTQVTRCWAARSRCLVLLAQGLGEQALASATLSVDAAVAAKAPMETAFSRLVRGRALAATGGNRSDAIGELRAAQVIFERAGAGGPLQQVGRALRELGVATVPRQAGPRPAVGALSRREQEVAELIAEGLTNPAIASRLFVSSRTVESHVSRIFTKLGVHNRSEVGRLVRQARLLEDLDGEGIGT